MRNFSWQLDKDSGESTTTEVKKVQFGDGYEQATSIGINNSRRRWQCKKTDRKTVIDDIYRFLISTKGAEIFTITPIPNEPQIKVRLDGEVSRNQVGGDVWTISFNLKQVF